MQQRYRRTTLKDVAREAGVSSMTVSKALNGKPGVSEETRRRIETIARRLRYSPNRVAQSLRQSKTDTIGVVMSDSSQNVFANLILGLSQAAAAAGYGVLLTSTGQDAGRETEAIDLLVSKRVDGIVLAAASGIGRAEVEALGAQGIPLVFLMRAPRSVEVDQVINDNHLGGHLSADYLYRRGYRDFYFIGLDSSPGRERVRGYRDCLAGHGMDAGRLPVQYTDPTIADGQAAMRRLLREGLRSGTICCGCDMIAIGAMDAILEAGFAIPGDFRVIGYDDFDLAGYLRVPLTTICQPIGEMGAEGFRLLKSRIDEPERPCRSIILPPRLVVRESA